MSDEKKLKSLDLSSSYILRESASSTTNRFALFVMVIAKLSVKEVQVTSPGGKGSSTAPSPDARRHHQAWHYGGANDLTAYRLPQTASAFHIRLSQQLGQPTFAAQSEYLLIPCSV